MAAESKGQGSGWEELFARAEAAISSSKLVLAQAEASLKEAAEARQRMWRQEELLPASPHARLQARAASLPVIEQAKGVIMAQWHCSEDEAFDKLRQASQQINKPVRELAAIIVARASRSGRTGEPR